MRVSLWRLIFILFTLALGACSSTGTTLSLGEPEPAPAPEPAPEPEPAPAPEPAPEPAPAPAPEPAPAPAPAPEPAPVAAVFEPILPELEIVEVPLRLPKLDPFVEYANLFEATADGYFISLDLTPDCNGAGVCSGGFVSAQPLADTIDDPASVEIALPNGITGKFFDSTCGANCSESVVSWVEGTTQYSIGIGFKYAVTMPFAVSAIAPTAEFQLVEPECPPRAPDAYGNAVAPEPFVATTESSGDFVTPTTWLVYCFDDVGSNLTILPNVADQVAFNYDVAAPGFEEDRVQLEVVVTQGPGTPWTVFSEGGFPLIDNDTFERFMVQDPRCADIDGDGLIDIVDAARNVRVGMLFNSFVETLAIDGNFSDLPRC